MGYIFLLKINAIKFGRFNKNNYICTLFWLFVPPKKGCNAGYGYYADVAQLVRAADL